MRLHSTLIVVLLLGLRLAEAMAADAPKAPAGAAKADAAKVPVAAPAKPMAALPAGKPATAPAAAAVSTAPASVETSSAAAKPRLEDYYTGAKKRDPFSMVGGGGGGGGAKTDASGEIKEFNPEEIDPNEFLHKIILKGLMRDKGGALALLVDPDTDTALFLKGGKLYDYKRNLIKGIQGEVNIAQKTVKLKSPDKETRTLRLGEDEASDEGSGQPRKDRGESP